MLTIFAWLARVSSEDREVNDLMHGYLRPGERRVPEGLEPLSDNDDPLLRRLTTHSSPRSFGVLDFEVGRPSLPDRHSHWGGGDDMAWTAHAKLIAQVAFPDRWERESDVLVDLLKDRDRLDRELDEYFATLDDEMDNWIFD